MRRAHSFLITMTFVANTSLLIGCGGGGNPTPAPRTVANTSSTHYLPMGAGNTWTFAEGARIVDEGPLTLSCTCPDNGGTIEQMNLYTSDSTLTASFFFATYRPSGAASSLTTLIGSEQPGATAATVASTTQTPYGLPIMDDNPTVGEAWSDGLGDTSTITTVDGTVAIADNQEVIDVATDSVAAGGSTSFTWSFAKGVGFAAIAEGGSSTNLATFSLGAPAGAGVTTMSIKGFVANKPADIGALAAAVVRAR
jgi:hypothetical protein